MIDVEFVSVTNIQNAAWATPVYKNMIDLRLPPLALEALEKKKRQPAVEIFIPENKGTVRFIALRVAASSTKKEREESGAALYQKFSEGEEEVLVFDIRNQVEQLGLDLISGFLLAGWRFNKYRTAQPEKEKFLLQVLCQDPKNVEAVFFRTRAILEGVFYARSLTSEPPNVLFPAAYAERLRELEEQGVGLEILDPTTLQKLGMRAILGVGKGSVHAPCVAILTWKGPSSPGQPIVIVGKGVTFDSGGLCLKSKVCQQEMKWDKAGAGVVAGLMKSLALQKAPVHVIGIIGLAENMPDGNALKPGDIIRTSSGQTIEITDTDSEGRLVLADCLWYAQNRFKPKAMLDLGTLTLETVAALGNVYGGLYTNSAELAKQLKEAGEVSGDRVWELPMGASYAKQLESSVADMKNEGHVLCGENGAAAEFIRKFTNGISWAHLDIAGVSWTKEDLPLAHKGVTGFGVRLLEEWLHAFDKDIYR
ncbi:MAG: leucyl aminopeptidase [Candidatus Protochlamydia sp.]|nr:leucyl aminopeptidase [Candidatus Protochlamydia sp.]